MLLRSKSARSRAVSSRTARPTTVLPIKPCHPDQPRLSSRTAKHSPPPKPQHQRHFRTSTSLSCGGLDVVLVPEQRHKAAPHIVALLFVRRGFDVARPTAKLRDDHPVGECNAAHSEEIKKAIRTTDGAHPALGPFGTIVRQLGNVSRLRESSARLRSSFARPWFPVSRTVADTVVSNGR